MSGNDEEFNDEFLLAIDSIETTLKKADMYRPLPPPYLPTFLPAPPPSTTISSSLSHPMQLQYSAGQQRKQIQVRDPFLSYSPPRELSQRVVSGFNDALMDYSNSTVVTAAIPISPTTSNRRCDSEKDLETDRLKVRFRFIIAFSVITKL